MRPSRNEDNIQKTGLRPEPLCLFCPPDETCTVARTSYVNALPKEQPRGYEDSKAKQREEFWLRKRTEARIRRRRMKEPIRNLKSFLLTSVKHEQKALPSLFEVLETVKDAWPSPPSRSKAFLRHDEKKPSQPQNAIPKESKMKEDQRSAAQLLTRRFSMPEELMRRYSASKERTSEDSETNKTMVEVSSPSSSSSSSLDQEETARRRLPEVETARVVDPPKRPAHTHNARIIKVKGACTCRRNRGSSTTASAKETDESGTSESLSSSSPTQLPKRESSSGDLSSESTDHIRCTCAEMTSSKETSTDLFHSGKSTLSQTVSDKSFSTQDSTASINSVSTRGSTVTDNSISTTPEMERTSAKETTTSPDYSPRSPRQNTNRKNRRRDKLTSCPWHTRCPIHPERPPKTTSNAATNTEHKTEDSVTQTHKNEVESANKVEDRYKWAKLSQEELYMMQQLRHRKFVESQRRLSSPLPPAQSDIPLSTGNAYQEADALMIPRYSALPRTLSMLVNTSSPDTSLHNSDSDNQSLADSLEDQPVTHMHKLYFDTKKESKPVRGDVNVSQESKPKHKGPRGRAFFVSIKDPYGEDEMLENIEKIPQPPEKIKNQIFERHLNLCAKHQHLHKSKTEGGQKKKKAKTKTEEPKKNANEDKEKPKEGKTNLKKKKEEGKDQKGKGFNSKIPVPVSSRSTSSSPEREQEVKEKQQRPKIRVRRDGDKVEGKGKAKEVEATQIMEITQTGSELSLQKPQAVIHPSQVPLTDRPKNQLSIPPLVSTLRMQRQQWNKPLLLSQTRRSPVGKFRQRFEVIPEEKSSSLSSAEEKNGPKRADASTSPLLGENQFQTYSVNEVPNLLMAKITNKQLETLPYVKNNDSQKIILFSSKGQNSNSSKGRDALIAMNREDFNRLAKGWVNFYKLSETVDNSDNEDNTKSNKNKQPQAEKSEPEGKITNDKKEDEEGAKDPPKEKEPEPDENLRFHSSNTILSHGLKKQTSLPELKPPNQTKVAKYPENDDDEDDTDSDGTDYLEPPSPRVPPLPTGGIPSDGTISSSDSELDDEKPQSLKYLQFKRRGANNRAKGKKEPPFETKKKNSGWSVTVAGTVELSRSAPDLEMRLSFPVNGAPPVVSQSDSGFAEDSTNSKLSESLQDLDMYTSRKELPFGSHQKWLLTVKNPKQGSTPDLRELSKNSSHRLPEVESSRNRNASKLLKDAQLEDKLKRVVERKMRAIWPKVQKVIKKEFLTESGRLITELENGLEDDFCLLVRGSAVSLERKEKPPTMTERDVTRRRTSRTDA